MKKVNEITDQDLQELGISKPLFDEWLQCMKGIMIHFRIAYGREFKQREGSNDLIFRDWTISAGIVNDSFVEITAIKGDTEMMTIRHHDNLPALIHSLETIIQSI